MRNTLLAVFSIFLFVSSSYAQSPGVGTKWVNNAGSELTIDTISAEGLLNGTYVNKAAGYKCQNEPMAVVGWVDGSLLTFAVRWKNKNVACNSITAWTGYYASGKIFTDWDLVYTSSETGLPAHVYLLIVFCSV